MSLRDELVENRRTTGRSTVRMAAVLMVAIAGCGGGDAPELSNAGGTGKRSSLADLSPIPRDGAGGGTTRVLMILPHEMPNQMIFWREAAQLDASRGRAVLTVRVASEGESVADLVRKVTREGASALLVAVDDAESLGPALVEARDRGVKLVTIDRKVEIEGDPVPAVERPEYGPAADGLVAAAREDAERLGKSPEGPALVLHVSNFPAGKTRALALVDAAERAGVSVLGGEPMEIDGTQPETTEAVRKILEEHPDLAMILTGDDYTFVGAIRARSEQPEGTGMSLAGFLVDPSLFASVKASYASAGAFADERVIGIYGLRALLHLAEGEAVDEVTVTPMPVRRAPGPPSFGYFDPDALAPDSPTQDLESFRGGPPTPRGGQEPTGSDDPS